MTFLNNSTYACSISHLYRHNYIYFYYTVSFHYVKQFKYWKFTISLFKLSFIFRITKPTIFLLIIHLSAIFLLEHTSKTILTYCFLAVNSSYVYIQIQHLFPSKKLLYYRNFHYTNWVTNFFFPFLYFSVFFRLFRKN